MNKKLKSFSLLGALLLIIQLDLSAQTIAGETIVLDAIEEATPEHNIKVVNSYTLQAPPEGEITISAATNGEWTVELIPQTNPNVPPTFSQNFLRTETAMEPITDELDFAGRGSESVITTFDYSDGLGRPTQSIGVEVSPGGNDVIQPHEYNLTTGRVDRSFLPYTDGEVTNPGELRADPITDQNAFYATTSTIPNIAKDARPFAETDYENSPVSRVTSTTGLGAAYSDVTSEYDYMIFDPDVHGVSGINANIIKYKISGNSLIKEADNYGLAQLTISEVQNEASASITVKSQSITDLRGLNIANRIWDGTNWVTTYNVYDDMGRLRFVLPPNFNGAGITDLHLAELAFMYQYDHRGRLIAEHKPGQLSLNVDGTLNETYWNYYVYDQWDRLVLEQDPELGTQNKYRFYKYDNFNRLIFTGNYSSNDDLSTIRTAAMAETDRFESWVDDNTPEIGYTHTTTFPTDVEIDKVKAVYFYDSYDCKSDLGWATALDYTSPSELTVPSVANTNVLDLTTGSMVKTTDNIWLRSVVYYDDRYRAIQTITENHLGGTDKLTTQLEWDGEVTATLLEHDGPEDVKLLNEYEYDTQGRLLASYLQINTEPKVQTAAYDYNELGEVISKELHSIAGGTPLQTLDYSYTIQGWLKTINDPALTGDDVFGAKYYYEDAPSEARTDGSIAAIEWNGDNQLAEGSPQRTLQTYTYNEENQLEGMDYATGDGSTWTSNAGDYNTSTTYDENGNIQTMIRNEAGTEIDNLTYTYKPGSNRLDQVEDASGDEKGFKNQGVTMTKEYDYNANGDLAADENKEIVSITYNKFLNLPKRIEFFDGSAVTYIYDMAGNRLNKTISDGDGNIIYSEDYVGPIVYRNGVIHYIYTEQGRAIRQDIAGQEYHHEYYITDHQGNTRAAFGILPERNIYSATMEVYAADQEENDFVINAATRSSDQNHTPGGFNSAKLTGTSNVLGPAKVIRYNSGDQVDMSAWAFYNLNTSFGTESVGQLLSALSSGLASAATGIPTEAQTGISTTLGGSITGLPGGNALDDEPSASLGYIFFNDNFEVESGMLGFDAVTDLEENNWGLKSLSFSTDEDGYLYIFTSNESNSNEPVYFDDLEIDHKSGTASYRVTQLNEYYPFGMLMATSWRDPGYDDPGDLYQGNFANFDFYTGYYDFKSRKYDPVLGQFMAVDPANQFGSPYMGMGNLPHLGVDPNGEWFGVDDGLAFIIGGTANLVSNALQGNLSGQGLTTGIGKGLAAFAAGGASGTLSLYGPAGWLAGGAILGGTNAWLGGATSPAEIAAGAGTGALTGLVGGTIGQAIGPFISGLTDKIASPVLQGISGGAIGGAVTGGLFGGASSAINGGSFWEGAGNGAIQGAFTGALTGGVSAYAYSKVIGINPWNGQRIGRDLIPVPSNKNGSLTPNEIGRIGENELKKQGFVKRSFDLENTGLGRRDADGYKIDPEFGVVIAESKTGYASNTKFIRTQGAKDLYLLRTKQVQRVEWHFYRSPRTGKIGPSLPLLKQLSQNGIFIFIHN
ncbi:MAG: hypothetical protein JXQ90_21075 [Cyclobacteriaceae bacterium]